MPNTSIGRAEMSMGGAAGATGVCSAAGAEEDDASEAASLDTEAAEEEEEDDFFLDALSSAGSGCLR